MLQYTNLTCYFRGVIAYYTNSAKINLPGVLLSNERDMYYFIANFIELNFQYEGRHVVIETSRISTFKDTCKNCGISQSSD